MILCIVDADLYLTVFLAGDKRCNLKRTVTSESISLSKKPEHCFARLILPKIVFSSDLIIVIVLITDSDLLCHCKQLQHDLLCFYNLTDWKTFKSKLLNVSWGLISYLYNLIYYAINYGVTDIKIDTSEECRYIIYVIISGSFNSRENFGRSLLLMWQERFC